MPWYNPCNCDCGRGCFNELSLAAVVLVLGIASISTIAGVIIGIRPDSATDVFNILVPVYASWIGTVLAYYFGKENYRAANEQAQQQAQQLSNTAPDVRPVSDIMKPRSSLVVHSLPAVGGLGADPATVAAIQALFVHRVVTRLPILTANDFPAYMIHNKEFSRYISIPSGQPHHFDPVNTTLNKFITDRSAEVPPILYNATNGFVTVRPATTLNQASAILANAVNAKDIIVTATGDDNSPVLGWISNLKLAEYVPIGP